MSRSQFVALMVTIILIPIAALVGLQRLDLDMNVLNVLPDTDPVVSDSRAILADHPIMDVLVIDLQMADSSSNRERLADAADFLCLRLAKSKLVRSVDKDRMGSAFSALIDRVVAQLPYLFSQEELNRAVAPILEPENLEAAAAQGIESLYSLDGMGQLNWLQKDPLSLRNLVLARFKNSGIADADIYREFPITKDGRHVLVKADLAYSGADNGANRELSQLLKELQTQVNQTAPKLPVVMTPVGTYRASLDNESIIRKDATWSMIAATIGIFILIMLAISRPWLGLMAFVPALAGAALALFVYSIFKPSISILTIGFGGALISITIDHGIAFVLFLDRGGKKSGEIASRKVWAVGLIVTLTSIGALFSLSLSHFPVLSQIGLFAGLGIGLSFLYVHTVFPFLLPEISERKSNKQSLLVRIVEKGTRSKSLVFPLLATGFFLFAALFAKPNIMADLSAINTVSDQTLQAESVVQKAWGNPLDQQFIHFYAKDEQALFDRFDRLAAWLDSDAGKSIAAFHPGLFFPGKERAKSNLKAWLDFWTKQRKQQVRESLDKACGQSTGCTQLFADFEKSLVDAPVLEESLPEEAETLMSVQKLGYQEGYSVLCPMSTSDNLDSEVLYQRLVKDGFSYYSPALFTQRLSKIIGDTFLRMFLIVGLAVCLMMVVFLLDWRMVLYGLIPITFGLVCTLATLNWLGRAVDIPGLMLSIIILGMGIDYGLYFIRSHQLHFRREHEDKATFRTVMFLAGTSTMIGMGTLALSDHNLLSSAGTTMLLAIFYTLVGNFAILTPLLNRLVGAGALKQHSTPNSGDHLRTVRGLYSHTDAYTRMFARFKLRLDPMFAKLDGFVGDAREIIDIGSGYGAPAAWLLSLDTKRRFYMLEPDPIRAAVLDQIFADHGSVFVKGVPGIPERIPTADAALMLDMAHYLDDNQLEKTLAELRQKLKAGGKLIMRVTIPTEKKFPWERYLEMLRSRLFHLDLFWRTRESLCEAVTQAGFIVEAAGPSAKNREETWIVATTGGTVLRGD